MINFFHKHILIIQYVFTFPRFCSIFFVDISQIFYPSHTYLKHGTVMGSNICDGIRNICDGIGFSHTFYVYRHANLCSGLRAILSPQLIKKNFAILSILPRMWHRSDSNPQSSRTMSIIQIGRSTDYAMGQ